MKRTQEAVLQEYREKWSQALAAGSMEEVRDAPIQHALQSTEEPYTSLQLNMIYYGHPVHGTWNEYKKLQQRMIRNTLGPYFRYPLCELGCGPGYQLYGLAKAYRGLDAAAHGFYGGEFVPEAVEVARKFGQDVVEFNYYNMVDYDIIRPDSVVFTVHSIEQLPDATPVIEGLRSQRHKIVRVVHFEPAVTQTEECLRYAEEKDYNRNLCQLLEAADDIEILRRTPGVLGAHPLNVAGIIEWRFRKEGGKSA